MRVEWSGLARSDLLAIFDYILQDNPSSAIEIEGRIRDAVARLVEHPRMGRPGHAKGTRELVIPGTPYVVVYGVKEQRVEVLRVFHSTRDWPRML